MGGPAQPGTERLHEGDGAGVKSSQSVTVLRVSPDQTFRGLFKYHDLFSLKRT